MADFYDLPFNDILNWRKFSLILRERDFGILKKELQGVTREEYRILHAGVRQVSFVEQMYSGWNPSVNWTYLKNWIKYLRLTRDDDTLGRAADSEAFRVALTTCQVRRFSYGYVWAVAPQVHHQVLDSSRIGNQDKHVCLHWEKHAIHAVATRYCKIP